MANESASHSAACTATWTPAVARITQRSTSSTPAAANRVATPPKIRASQRTRCELRAAAATEGEDQVAEAVPGAGAGRVGRGLAGEAEPGHEHVAERDDQGE
jgi:hypothetical protein